jgi:hypothetical protein
MVNLLTCRRFLALTSIVDAVGMVSCANKNEAEPIGGVVQGELNVAGATNAITLTGADGKTASVAPDVATGKFVFDKVSPGTYSLTAVPARWVQRPQRVFAQRESR